MLPALVVFRMSRRRWLPPVVLPTFILWPLLYPLKWIAQARIRSRSHNAASTTAARLPQRPDSSPPAAAAATAIEKGKAADPRWLKIGSALELLEHASGFKMDIRSGQGDRIFLWVI